MLFKAIVTETAKIISSYVFDQYQQRLTLDPNNSNENVLYFFYQKDQVNGQYVVHYMTEKVDGTGFEEHDSFTGKLSDGSTYNVPNPPKTIEHFTWAQGYNDGTNIEKMSGAVQVGEVLELWVYYTRNEYSYTVKYLDHLTSLPVHDEKTGTAKWESQVTENAVVVANYELVSNESYTIDITDNAGKNIIVFYYVKNVTINYQVIGQGGEVEPTSETIGAVSGIAEGSTPNAANGFKFVGWYLDENGVDPVPAEWVEANGKIVPQKTGDLWTNATYFAKFDYNLTTLTIVKSGAEYYTSIDPNQTFIFNISGNGINLDVTVHGSDWDVVVDGLTVGATYTITEKNDWSWRYNCTGWYHDNGGKGTSNIAQITIGLNGTITFTNTRGNEQWLDGDSWCNNIFN